MTSGPAALTLAVAVAGCGEKQEYAVPEKVCGVPLEEGTVALLLPEGEHLAERGTPLPAHHDYCRLLVDRGRALTVTFSPTRTLHDPMGDRSAYAFTRRAEMRDLPLPGEGALGDDSAVVAARCGGSGPGYLTIDFYADKDVVRDTARRRAALREFALAYTSGARKKAGCAG
ncbi:hypothetical protein [Streptomyces sp. JJ36]|uniref:hypothetical protein n=1 Tax=Streptomyces sp. JJ36 TaxID=2736645 RepID=UPI001F48672D|nr:hypothetical protein [Streptomyces sp. JJ36]MCF6526400.1 hypothetical protein [Streptomyces sp. JJ36]